MAIISSDIFAAEVGRLRVTVTCYRLRMKIIGSSCLINNSNCHGFETPPAGVLPEIALSRVGIGWPNRLPGLCGRTDAALKEAGEDIRRVKQFVRVVLDLNFLIVDVRWLTPSASPSIPARSVSARAPRARGARLGSRPVRAAGGRPGCPCFAGRCARWSVAATACRHRACRCGRRPRRRQGSVVRARRVHRSSRAQEGHWRRRSPSVRPCDRAGAAPPGVPPRGYRRARSRS